MSTMIQFNMNEVPLEVPLVNPGVRQLKVFKAPKIEPVQKNNVPTGQNQLVLDLQIIDDLHDKDKGRPMTARFVLGEQRDMVKLKRACVSANLVFGGDGSFDATQFLDRSVTAVVAHTQPRVDPKTGKTEVFAYVQDFVLPGEPGYVG